MIYILIVVNWLGSTIESPNNRATLSPSSTLDTVNRTCQPNTTDRKHVPKIKSTNDRSDSLLPDVKTVEVPNINQKPAKSILKKKNLVEHEIRASLDLDIEGSTNETYI